MADECLPVAKIKLPVIQQLSNEFLIWKRLPHEGRQRQLVLDHSVPNSQPHTDC